jgi:nucleoside-diphosphate-sugar epimerase
VRPTSSAGALIAAGAATHIHDGSYQSLHAAAITARPDIVFHLASELQRDQSPVASERLLASNILFGTQLAEAALAAGCTRFVNTGTFWQHFGGEGYDPVDLYAATKQAFQDLLLFYHKARGLSCVTLKPYDNYGPDDFRRKIINLLIDAHRVGAALDCPPANRCSISPTSTMWSKVSWLHPAISSRRGSRFGTLVFPPASG